MNSPSFAKDFPIFDAHIHYNQPDWAVYTPAAIFKILDRAGVDRAIVSSTPDDGTLRLFEKAPARIIPILRPYRSDDDRRSWTRDAAVLSFVEKRLQSGIYRGIGEFHLPAREADSFVVLGFAKLAAERGIFLYAHTEDDGIENLLRRFPKVRILWAHAGMSAPAATLDRLLQQYSKLFIETSIRTDIAPGGRLDPFWRDLFLRYPDRFMVGSDTWITPRWESVPALHAEFRQWFHQLPRDIAERIAFKNAHRLIGKEN